MDCKHFRKLHLAFLDGTLPATEMAAAQGHLQRCDGCAAHDTTVRRSLMVARNLPLVEPSPAFEASLRVRLAACREQCAAERLDTPRPTLPSAGWRATRTAAAVAASTVLGLLAYQALRRARADHFAAPPVMAVWFGPSAPASGFPSALPSVSARPSAPRRLMTARRDPLMWPSPLLLETAPVPAMSAGFSQVSLTR